MLQREVLDHYIHEVGNWCESVLHILDSRAVEIYDVQMLEYRIQTLLDRLQENYIDYDIDFVYELSNDVESIENQFQEVFASGHYEEYARGIQADKVRSVPIGSHVLPPLPYPYEALEPYISKEIMQIHHDKHHRSYVEGLNKAEKMMEKARESGDYDLLKHWEREAAFHGSGHYLHTIFWNNMQQGGGQPSGKLLRLLKRDFGSFEWFKRHFTEAANRVEGSGWALLVWSPRSGRLEILQTTSHHLFSQLDTLVLLALDVWEHAYYLQYKNQKDEYIRNWWHIVNWNNVAERLAKAEKVEWQPY
ncbi:superoxide dismutase [Ectobacillus polymachus]|uniref:superoxide dismutase n=1 Tax=Ectobacillus polymachus TaxID=1508806 RepID=UPI003A862945